MKVFGSISKGKPTYVNGYTLYVLAVEQRLTLVNQTLESQTDYSLYSGKLAKRIKDVTVCAYLKNRRSGFSFMASGETVNTRHNIK